MMLAIGSCAQQSGTPKPKPQSPTASLLSSPFAASIDPGLPVTFHNPVIPGFFSDPSVCKAGDDYYLVTSTFEYFPGVPVFHSKDLVNWEMIGYCLSRKSQLPDGLDPFACTIRYHEGTFYMITTNVISEPGANGTFSFSAKNFFVTATNPAGPWSDPVWVDARGIDPDLFFDTDGKTYVISSTFELNEIDLRTGKFINEGKKIWNGNGGRYPEGPHIYKKDGFYYLMDAEGGTEEAHSETIARSKNIWGPYNANPANPILTHVNGAGMNNPIQGVGHADIIQSQEGSYWMVFHGYRTVGGGVQHILGRETCLAPVCWPTNGWPVVNGNGTVTVDMNCPTLPQHPFAEKPAKEEFNSDQLGLEWNYIHYPEQSNYSLSARKGYLRLTGSPQTIEDRKNPIFVGRRLQDMYFTATTQIEFDPKSDKQEAGLILLNNGVHFDILIKQSRGKRVLVSRLRFGSVVYESTERILKPGPVYLRVTGEKSTFIFSYSQDNNSYSEVQKVDAKFLSSETVGGFTGVFVGLYATGNSSVSTANADYGWFEYDKNEAPK